MPRLVRSTLAPVLVLAAALACGKGGSDGAGAPGGGSPDGGATDGGTGDDARGPTTTATPPGGTYPGPLTVALATDVPADVFYTTDGSEPTTLSSVYSAPISVKASTDLRFFARDRAGAIEPVRRELYALPSSLRYSEVQQKSVHNAYDRDEPLFDQLVYHRVRSVELDVHTGLGGKPDVPGDWYVYHEDLPLFRGTSCALFGQCLDVLAGFHRAVPDHEVVTLLVDLKDGFGTGHSRDDLDAILRKRLGADVLFQPKDLFARCTGAATLRETVASACAWPTLDELRGRFVVLFTGGTACDAASHASAYLAPPGGPRDRAGFAAPNVDDACTVALTDAKKDVVFANLDEGHLAAAKPLAALGLVTRAYKGGLQGGFDDQASWDAAKAAGVHLVATNKVNYLESPWTVMHQKNGWPFSCFGPCPGSRAEKDRIFGVEVDSGDAWDRSDSAWFRHAGPGPVAATWTAFVSTVSSHAEPWAKACIAARAGLEAGAAYYAICRPQDAHAVRIQARATAGATTDSVDAATAPGLSEESGFFLRLTLAPSGAGTQATAEVSADGVTFRRVDQRVVGSPLAYQGILASSHGAGPATFSFGDVVRASGGTSTPIAAATLPKTTLLGGAKSGRSWDGTVRP